MKKTILLLLTLLSTQAFASVSEIQKDLCESAQTKALMGSTGSCLLLATPQSTPDVTRGCVGNLVAEIYCMVVWVVQDGASAMQITCGPDLNNPILKNQYEAKATTYTGSAIIKTAEGKEILVDHPNVYESLRGGIVQIEGVTEPSGEKSQTINVSLGGATIPLKGLICE